MRILVVFLLLGQCLAGAVALAEDKRLFFFGSGSAQMNARDYCDGVVARSRALAASAPLVSGFAAGAFRCEDGETAKQMMTGFHLGERTRLELGWGWAEGFAASDTVMVVAGSAELPLEVSMDADIQSAYMALERLLPLGHNFALMGKIGVHLWDLDARFNVPDAARQSFAGAGIDLDSHFDMDGRDLMYGAGMEYALDISYWHRMRIGVEWLRFQADDNNVDSMGITLEWDF